MFDGDFRLTGLHMPHLPNSVKEEVAWPLSPSCSVLCSPRLEIVDWHWPDPQAGPERRRPKPRGTKPRGSASAISCCQRDGYGREVKGELYPRIEIRQSLMRSKVDESTKVVYFSGHPNTLYQWISRLPNDDALQDK